MLVRTYEGIAPVDELRTRLAEITAPKSYRAEVKKAEEAERYQRSRAAGAMRVLTGALGGAGLAAPRGVLNDMRIHALHRDASRGGPMGDAAARALERIFVQVAFYIPNELEAQQRLRDAAVVLGIAAGIFPSRPGPWYSLAQLRARADDATGRSTRSAAPSRRGSTMRRAWTRRLTSSGCEPTSGGLRC